MRIMNLPNLPAGPNSLDECVKTYLERRAAGDAPWPHVSTLLMAYMSWPNDQERGNSFVATCLTRLGISSEVPRDIIIRDGDNKPLWLTHPLKQRGSAHLPVWDLCQQGHPASHDPDPPSKNESGSYCRAEKINEF
jgi:hypothetical protein